MSQKDVPRRYQVPLLPPPRSTSRGRTKKQQKPGRGNHLAVVVGCR